MRAKRQTVLDHAYQTHPHRFRHPPQAPKIPTHSYINPPQEKPNN